MTRDTASSSNKVALLATGDEITNGDILNTNAQIIAHKLFSHGIRVGTHMAVADNIAEIEHAMEYLLKTHKALIITGGLGPTSDDLTRFALSKVTNKPLVFNDAIWQSICDRFKLFGYTGEPPEGNRQQALFPETAVIIENPGGTAAGCYIQHQDHLIFMLPGPPAECLPMIDTLALPFLQKHGLAEIAFFDYWLLFGIGESLIASQLDNVTKPFDMMTGYRLAFPYIEFKLYSNHQQDFKTAVPLVEKIIAPYLISDGKQTASSMLQKKLENFTSVLKIHDTATGGALENALKTQKNAAHLNFSANENADIKISGLKEFWEDQNTETTLLEISFPLQKIHKKIPYRGRGPRVKMYAVELISQLISQFISTDRTN